MAIFTLAALAIVVGACAVSKTLEKMVQKVEASLKTSILARRIFGLTLIALASFYIYVGVRMQQSDARDKSPVVQQQMVLKFHTENLAKELYSFADKYEQASKEKNQIMDLNPYYDRYYYWKIDGILEKLKEEGIDTQTLSELHYQAVETARGMNQKPLGSEARDIAKELEKKIFFFLANEKSLPNDREK